MGARDGMTMNLKPKRNLLQKSIQTAEALLLLAVLASGCGEEPASKSLTPSPAAAPSPVSQNRNVKLTNCRFQTASPVYSYGQKIQPNPIVCGEGKPTSAQLLSNSVLPTGLVFSNQTLSGTASEKMSKIPYTFYLENEIGYVLTTLTITIQ